MKMPKMFQFSSAGIIAEVLILRLAIHINGPNNNNSGIK